MTGTRSILIAALAVLAGCDVDGGVNKAGPANVASETDEAPTPAAAVGRRLKPLFVSGSTRIDPQTDVDTLVVSSPEAIVLVPTAADAGPGRLYVIHAQTGTVILRFAGIEGPDATSQIFLRRGESAILMSTGDRRWIRIHD